MGWLLRSFGSALIWNGVREARYQAHRQRPARQRRLPVVAPPSTPADRIIITFVCQKGHQHVVETTDVMVNANPDGVLGRERCPECHGVCRWQTIDQHLINRS